MKKLFVVAAISFAACVVAVGVYKEEWSSYKELISSSLSQIKTVQIVAPVKYVTEQEIKDLVTTKISGKGFFNINMQAIKAKLKQNPWVYDVEIIKIWPDKIRITFEEDSPLAYLNNNGIITSRNRAVVNLTNSLNDTLLATDDQNDRSFIPMLVTSENKYKKLCDTLEKLEISVKPIDVRIKKLVMSQRNSIYVELSNGLTILLGTNDIINRMNRLVKLYDILNKDNQFNSKDGHAQFKYYVDMRYRNGLAIGKQQEQNLIELMETA